MSEFYSFNKNLWRQTESCARHLKDHTFVFFLLKIHNTRLKKLVNHKRTKNTDRNTDFGLYTLRVSVLRLGSPLFDDVFSSETAAHRQTAIFVALSVSMLSSAPLSVFAKPCRWKCCPNHARGRNGWVLAKTTCRFNSSIWDGGFGSVRHALFRSSYFSSERQEVILSILGSLEKRRINR